MNLVGGLRAYVGHDDPLAAAANTLALVIAFNAPLYPPTVLWYAGSAGQPWVWLTAVSFPFFLAVPALMRRSAWLGRAAFLTLSIANTAFCNWLLGDASGTNLFLFPCVLLAPLLFRRAEWVVGSIFTALPFAIYLGLSGRWGIPPHVYSAPQYAKLFATNAVSVALLLAFVGLVFGRMLARKAASAVSGRAGPDQP